MQEMQETQVQSLGQEDVLEEEMETYSSIFAWEVPWTEEPDGLQFIGLQRVKHDWVTEHALCTHAYTRILGTLNVLRAKETENKILSLPPRSFQSNGRDKQNREQNSRQNQQKQKFVLWKDQQNQQISI